MDNPQNAVEALGGRSNNGSPRKILAMERKFRPADQGLEACLSAALQAADSEFGSILQEVDKISQLLKSGEPDLETLRVASHPAVWSAVKQALLDRELRQLALTDDLTCLYNRRGFFAAGTQLLKLAARNSQGLLVFYCDLDNLKRINDSYGHHEGDLAIVRTADALEHSFRGADVLARIGGDEFAVLALESSQQSRDVILRRLTRNLKKANTLDSRYPLSLSVGISRFDPKHPATFGDLMLQADQAMYEEKRRRQQAAQINSLHEPRA